MNVVPLEPGLPEALRRQLAARPAFEPPARVREAVLGAAWGTRPSRPSRPLRAAAVAGVVVCALLGSGVALRRAGDDALPAASTPRVAALERELRGLRLAVADAPAAATLEAELARVDRALQSAYDAGAPAPRIDALWRDREHLLDGLVLAYRQPDRVIRI